MYQGLKKAVDKGNSARQSLKDERVCHGILGHSTVATTTITIISIIITNFCINITHTRHRLSMEVFVFLKIWFIFFDDSVISIYAENCGCT